MLEDTVKDTVTISVLVTTDVAFNRQNTDPSLSIYDVTRRFVLNEYEDKDQFTAAVNDYVTNTLGDTSENPIIKYLDPIYRYVSKKSPDQTLNLRIVSDSDVEESVWQLFDLSEEDLGIFIAWYSLYEMTKEDVDLTLYQANQYYIGWFSSQEDFAKHSAESAGVLDNIPEYLAEHIDFDMVGEDIMNKGSIREANNHYFNNY